MTDWKANCVILFVFSAILSGSASGEKVAKHNSYKNVLAQVANSLGALQIGNVSSKARYGYEVCADEGDVIFYCPGDEICCTPGDPESTCCPADHPLCVGKEYCCPVGYPKICGPYCCEEYSFCCNEATCCENLDACCGVQCCEGIKVCCNGVSCCDSVDACCGAQCCPDDAPCCKQDGTSACCDKVTMGCCDGYGCVAPCPSQFDAIGCQLSSLSLDDKLLETLHVSPKNLYRILRPDENPEGIVAKDAGAQKNVLSHVNCGSRPNYASQFISTSASLDVAKDYKEKGEKKGLPGLRICEFEVDKLPSTCKIVDLTAERNRDKYLGNAVCKKYAKASAELLLQCSVPVPCTVIDPPPKRDGIPPSLLEFAYRSSGVQLNEFNSLHVFLFSLGYSLLFVTTCENIIF